MPFIETALLDSRGASRSSRNSGDFINHYTGVRLRAVGSGNLDMTLYGRDKVNSFGLAACPLMTTDRVSKFRLSNFNSERARLRIETDEINETFRINRIIVFARPVATMEPA